MYDTVTTPPFQDMRQMYYDYFSLKFIATNMQEKFALISLIGYLVSELRKKKPDVTYYQLIKKLGPELPEDYVKSLSIICEDFAYGCTDFLTFGIEKKDMPKQVSEILKKVLPF